MSDQSELTESLTASVQLAGSVDVLQWARQHRKIKAGGRWKSFRLDREGFEYPFLADIYTELSLGHDTVIMKPTQVGATEIALNAALFFLDKKSENVMYLLPAKAQMRDFSHNRVDGAIDHSQYITNMFSDISNVGNKQTADGDALYLRGTNSSAGLEEVPVGFLIRDEIEKMEMENADLALKRLDASHYKWQLDLSHPEYPGGPIDKGYQNSSRGKWVITCPNCGTRQTLDWKENFYQRGDLGCKSCGASWSKSELWAGEWVHEEPANPTKGFKFTQLLSPTVTLSELKNEYEEAVNTGGYKIEQFFNTVLAEPYAAEGTTLQQSDVKNLMTGPTMGKETPDRAVMGVDVGNMLHWWIQSGDTVIKVGKTDSFEMLKGPLNKFNVKKVVIDAMPETRKAREFIDSVGISGWICRRSARLQSDKKVKEGELKVNAVEHHDKFVSQFNNQRLILPSDLPKEAVEHLTNPVRVIEKKNGKQKPRWEKGINHYWDAGAYALEAQSIQGNEPRIRSLT